MIAPAANRQLGLPFPHRPGYAAADFVADASNEEALAWLDLAADWPNGRLALWGEAGTGKTHLLRHWAERSGAELLCPAALREEPPGRAVALDDADLAPERPLLHLLNAAAEARLPVLLAGRAPPARWPSALPDLASRLRATVAVQIRPPEDRFLRALLKRLVADRQLPVPEPVQETLLVRLPRSPGALREAVARLDRRNLAIGGRFTRALAAEIAAEIAGAADDDDFASPSRQEPRLL